MCKANSKLERLFYIDGQLMQSYVKECACTITSPTNDNMHFVSKEPQSGSARCDIATFRLDTHNTAPKTWDCAANGFVFSSESISTTSPWRVLLTKTSSGLNLNSDIDTNYCLRVSMQTVGKLMVFTNIY